MPDITFLIDITGKNSKERMDQRELIEKYDQLSLENAEFIRESFLKIAKNDPERCKIIKGSMSKEEIHEEIIEHLNNYKKKEEPKFKEIKEIKEQKNVHIFQNFIMPDLTTA